MHADPVTPSSSSLTLPLNEALQRSDGAQFALMLSLMFEARVGQSNTIFQHEAMYPDQQLASHSNVQAPSYNLNHSLSSALQSNSVAHFNLINSLYHEKPLFLENERFYSAERIEQNNAQAAHLDKPRELLTNINQSRQTLAA